MLPFPHHHVPFISICFEPLWTRSGSFPKPILMSFLPYTTWDSVRTLVNPQIWKLSQACYDEFSFPLFLFFTIAVSVLPKILYDSGRFPRHASLSDLFRLLRSFYPKTYDLSQPESVSQPIHLETNQPTLPFQNDEESTLEYQLKVVPNLTETTSYTHLHIKKQ